jgi:hypothetical protein
VATVLLVGGSEGARRCDGKCHGAEFGSRCECVCLGRYHGLGAGARAQVVEDLLGPDSSEWLHDFERRAQELGGELVVVGVDGKRARRPAQLSLDELAEAVRA